MSRWGSIDRNGPGRTISTPCHPPTTAEELERAAFVLGRFGTDDYLRFLGTTNGAEGDAGGDFGTRERSRA